MMLCTGIAGAGVPVALSLASNGQLPVVFICHHNLFAEITPIADTMHVSQVADRALAYAMPGYRIDGNDPEAVSPATGVLRHGAAEPDVVYPVGTQLASVEVAADG